VQDILYDTSIPVIAIGLLALIVAAMELGRYIGRRHADHVDEVSHAGAVAAQGAVLGLLALLLGFTFSLALGHYDARTTAVVDEANAIGTAWLRTDLLPEPARSEARDLMQQYVAARVKASVVSLENSDVRDALVQEADDIGTRIWALAAQAAVTGGEVPLSFGEAFNDVLDGLGRRDAAVRHHISPIVLLALFGTFLAMGFVLGYCAGAVRARMTPPVYVSVGMTVMTVFLILDLDRPRRGLIEVDQTPLFEVAEMMAVQRP
jgi:hypothetical protein